MDTLHPQSGITPERLFLCTALDHENCARLRKVQNGVGRFPDEYVAADDVTGRYFSALFLNQGEVAGVVLSIRPGRGGRRRVCIARLCSEKKLGESRCEF
jgi:hypothetical protein